MSEAIRSGGDRALARLAVRGRALAIAGSALVAAASVSLFLVSRGKWSDAIIDSGREWIVPDALARGELLYRDVVYWFGPLTPYLHAAFFAVFGSSFRTLVLAGVVGSIAMLAALYYALTAVTGRRESALWTALAVPALVFMPNAGGPILGMGYRIWHAAALALCAVGLAARARSRGAFIGAGALAALSGLCRTEWGLATIFTLVVVALVGRERRGPAHRASGVLWALFAFAAVFGGVLAIFVAAAGWKAVVEDGHVLLTGLPQETREFLVTFSGVRDWKAGIAQLLYSTAMWVGAALAIDLLVASRDRAHLRRRLPVTLAVILVLAGAALAGGASGAVSFSAAPLVCLAAAIAGGARGGRAGWALLGFGLLGLLLSYRRPFHIGDSGYVGPPLVFAFVAAAGLLRLAVLRARPRARRVRLQTGLACGIATLAVVTFGARAFGYARDPRLPIRGTEGMLSARSDVAGAIEKVVAEIRARSGETDGLVVFPEGEVFNYLTGRRNPIRHKLYIPGYLNASNEAEILAELDRLRPRVVVTLRRPTGEYGAAAFGAGSGDRIRGWIESNYETVVPETGRKSSRPGPWATVAVLRRDAPG